MENKVHCDKHGIRPGTPRYQKALEELALVAEREDFKEVGAVCPRCVLLYHVARDAAQKMVDDLIDKNNDLGQRVEPGDILVEWARALPQCPRGCPSRDGWAKRACCDISRAISRWEARLVAETLMDNRGPAGAEEGGTVGFFGPVRQGGA